MVASAGPAEYRQAIELLLTESDVDALIVVFTPIDESKSTSVLAGIKGGIAAARSRGVLTKPVLACIMSDSTDHLPLRVWSETIPTYAFPENAARALGKVAAYASWRSQPAGLFWTFDDVHVDEARAICRQALARGDTWLTDRRRLGRPQRVRRSGCRAQPGPHRRRGGGVRLGHWISGRRQAGVHEGHAQDRARCGPPESGDRPRRSGPRSRTSSPGRSGSSARTRWTAWSSSR